MSIQCFTDASTSSIHKVSIVVTRIITDIIEEWNVYHLTDVDNTTAEMFGVDTLRRRFSSTEAQIHTDCQKACGMYPDITVKMTAHQRKRDCDELHLKFREVDLRARKELRRCVKSIGDKLH